MTILFLNRELSFFIFFLLNNICFAEACLLLGNVSHVSEVAHRPFIFDYHAFRWIYRLSYLYYALFAVIVSLVTGIVVTAISSYFTGKLLIEGCLSLHKSSN